MEKTPLVADQVLEGAQQVVGHGRIRVLVQRDRGGGVDRGDQTDGLVDAGVGDDLAHLLGDVDQLATAPSRDGELPQHGSTIEKGL